MTDDDGAIESGHPPDPGPGLGSAPEQSPATPPGPPAPRGPRASRHPSPPLPSFGVAHPAAVEKFIRRFRRYCDRLNVETSVQPLADGRVFITTVPCLTADLHSEGGEAGGVGVMPNGATFIACFHTHCRALAWADWRRGVEEKNGPMRLEGEIIWTKK